MAKHKPHIAALLEERKRLIAKARKEWTDNLAALKQSKEFLADVKQEVEDLKEIIEEQYDYFEEVEDVEIRLIEDALEALNVGYPEYSFPEIPERADDDDLD